MKQLFRLIPLVPLLASAFMGGVHADTTTAKVMSIANFGAKPDTGQDSMEAFQKAFTAIAAETGPVILQIPKGRYELLTDKATKMEYYITNTLDEGSNETKIIGLYMKGLKNLTIEGNDSYIFCRGRMTMALLDGCENVTIQNLHFDFARPTMSELKVTAISGNTTDFQVHPDSKYRVENNKVIWMGEGWENQGGVAQEYDPNSKSTWGCSDPIQQAKTVEEISPGLLRLTYDKPLGISVGQVIQIRDGIRDGVGMLIANSHNTTLRHVGMHYMHGLGIVGQASDTITLDTIDCSPRADSGRTNAGFADFVHLCCCRGKISILNSNFLGAQDDAVNIHGVHFQVESMADPTHILVAFKNGQTRGFNPFLVGDEIDFINWETLIPFGTVHVTASEMKDPHQILLTLDQPAPTNVRVGHDAVEDASATPEVEISGNKVASLRTRAFLVTSRRKVVIENNTVLRLGSGSVTIVDDAKDWFESGMVRDVTIQNNHFIDDYGPVIDIEPSTTKVSPDAPVHQNISILNNDFKIPTRSAVTAVLTKNLTITGNTITQEAPDAGPVFQLTSCLHVTIQNNHDNDAKKVVAIHNMSDSEVSLQSDFTLNK